MGHRLVIEGKIGLKWPILAISPLKLTFFDIKLAFKTPRNLTFCALESLQHTLGHISYGIIHENGS